MYEIIKGIDPIIKVFFLPTLSAHIPKINGLKVDPNDIKEAIHDSWVGVRFAGRGLLVGSTEPLSFGSEGDAQP